MIQRAVFQKFFVGARILDAAAIDYHDLIRSRDGAEAVGDDQNGLSRHQLTHGLLNNSFVLGVYVAVASSSTTMGASLSMARAMAMR